MPVRSKELQAWIDAQGTPEGVYGAVRDLSGKLREELLQEALSIDQIAQKFDEKNGLEPKTKEIAALKAYCSFPEIMGPVSMELAGWHERNVPSSNIIDSSALFKAVSPEQYGKKRPFHHQKAIASRSTVYIDYTGEELCQFDWDVLHYLICCSRDAFNVPHTITPLNMVKTLGLPINGQSYEQIFDSVVRLFEGSIYVQNTPKTGNNNFVIGRRRRTARGQVMGLHLISDYRWNQGQSLTFVLDSKLIKLFGNSEYGLIDWEKRRQLKHNDLAKKLQSMFSGQRDNLLKYQVSIIKDRSGLCSEMKSFTMKLIKALNLLCEKDVIKAYWISKPTRGFAETKMLYVWWREIPPQCEIPVERGTYTDQQVLAQNGFVPPVKQRHKRKLEHPDVEAQPIKPAQIELDL